MISELCPEGYSDLSIHSVYCYKYEKNKATYDEALSACKVDSGSLVEIYDKEENELVANFVASMLHFSSHHGDVYLGLRRASTYSSMCTPLIKNAGFFEVFCFHFNEKLKFHNKVGT